MVDISLRLPKNIKNKLCVLHDNNCGDQHNSYHFCDTKITCIISNLCVKKMWVTMVIFSYTMCWLRID